MDYIKEIKTHSGHTGKGKCMERWVYEKDYGSEYEAQIQANRQPIDNLLMEEIKKTKVLKEIETSMQACPRVLSESKRKNMTACFSSWMSM